MYNNMIRRFVTLGLFCVCVSILPLKTLSHADNLLPSVNECGAVINDRIYGGKVAPLGQYPWMALLESEDLLGTSKGFTCGGALINKRYILTAAHCIKGNVTLPPRRLVSVRLGEYNTSSEIDCGKIRDKEYCLPKPIDIAIESQIVHEEYDPSHENHHHDIALLRLAENVTYVDSISPICLPIEKQLNATFTENIMEVAGWGNTEEGSQSDVLLKVKVIVKDTATCNSIYKMIAVNVEDGQLCAEGLKGHPCEGDSGGPLMAELIVNGYINYYALGVVSFAPSSCGSKGWPGIYTRITKYVPWILSKLRS